MRRSVIYFPLLLAGLFIVSCSPSPILRLSPLVNETKWIYGKEFARSATDKVEIAVAFEREINHEKHLAELKTTKDKWESTTLRRTTLDPDQSVRGRVYFRAKQKALYIKLCFSIGEDSLQLIFYQQKIKV